MVHSLASLNPLPKNPIALGPVARHKVEAVSGWHGKVHSAHNQEIKNNEELGVLQYLLKAIPNGLKASHKAQTL